MVKLHCINTDSTLEFAEGTTLLEALKSFDFPRPYQIVSARVNNVSQGLKFRLYQNRTVEFLDYTSYSGRSVYSRSLCFLLSKATQDVFPGSKIKVNRPISKGYFCDLRKADASALTPSDVDAIRARMKELVDENLEFHRFEAPVEEAVSMFGEMGYGDKVSLLETSGEVYVHYHKLGDIPDYYYDALVPSTSYLRVWSLEPYRHGMFLRLPDRHAPQQLTAFVDQPKTFEVFKESMKWNSIMGLSNVGDVNKAILAGHASELIQVSEALQEKKIVQIAEEIERRYNDKEKPIRVVLITGPSSSGKTTVCKRLSIQIKACGLQPVFFSTDDYFVNRVETVKFPDGSYDFDNFETVDHRLLEADVMRLVAGEEIELPEYNFVTGLREYNGKKASLGKGKILIIEGLHALNPNLIPAIPDENKYRIFINTVTSISLDDHNCIPTSDNRLLRRIIRDFNKGAFTARESIAQWPNVRRSEVQWIYPYQETADVIFNSAYLVEFAVIRNHAERILATVPKNCPEYGEAHRLLKFIHYFTPVSDKEIPPTSLLREFVGGSSFKY